MSVDATLLARLLRQRSERGDGALFLEGASREELIAAARALARGGAPAPIRSGDAAGRSDEQTAVRRSEERERHEAPDEAADAAARRPVDPELAQALQADYDTLREVALRCTRCGLAEGRTQVVFSDGTPDARLIVVGEAPGANEDRTGLPFVGAAGKLLDLMLASVDLSRERDTYICNVLKCRPPGNRNPRPEEIDACAPFLRRQLELVAPEALLAVGTFAAQWLTGESRPLGRLRGSVHSYQGVPTVVTYHPAALLRNPGWTRASWDDLQLLRQILDGG